MFVVCLQLAVSCGRLWAGCRDRDVFVSVDPAAGCSDSTARLRDAPAALTGHWDVLRDAGGS